MMFLSAQQRELPPTSVGCVEVQDDIKDEKHQDNYLEPP